MVVTRSSDLSQIAVNANTIPDGSIDCGIRGLGWCRGANCQQYARLRNFVIVLAVAGLLEGACETYFRISAKQAAHEYDYSALIVDWLLVSSGIFQATLALGFTYWAERYHVIKWLVAALMLQAAFCVISVIPAIMNFADGIVKPTEELTQANLCATTYSSLRKLTLTQQQSSTLTLIMLFVLQLALGLGSLAYLTLGITYIDDNSISVDSPAVIATILAARIFGQQIGALLVLGNGYIDLGWWLGWIVLAILIFISAILLGLFPKRLPKTVIHQAAQHIIEASNLQRYGSQMSNYLDNTDFGASMRRLFGNKLLMFNLLSIMFLQAGVRNYELQQENYMQSRYFLPYNEQDGLVQEWRAAFIAYFLKPPVMAVGMLIAGLTISKTKLSARTITGINIGLGIHLIAIYVAFIFLQCDVGPVAGITAGKLRQPFCSRDCLCTPTAFMPVCPENSSVTYFSACYAGCRAKTTINGVQLYNGCSCQSDFNTDHNNQVRATEGACSDAICKNMLIIYQILSLSAAALIGLGTVGKTLITLRSVLPQDKSLALAFELFIVGFITYVPTHLAYVTVTRTTCVYWAPNYERCLLRETPKHGNILNILTASLVLAALLFDVLVFIYAKGLNMYNSKVTDVNYMPTLYTALPHEEPASLPTTIVGGSPITTRTVTTNSGSPLARRNTQLPLKGTTEPGNDITVFRKTSSAAATSADAASINEPNGTNATNGVTYAQVVFPPDRHKNNDGNASPKRLAVSPNVPLQHLSAQDVRAQLSALKSFSDSNSAREEQRLQSVPVVSGTRPLQAARSAVPVKPKTTPPPPPLTATNVDDELRPQSPETDF